MGILGNAAAKWVMAYVQTAVHEIEAKNAHHDFTERALTLHGKGPAQG
jgi:hypothetical protein